MRTALAYQPRPGPLGLARPWVAAAYLGPLAIIGFTFSNPLVLVSAGCAAVIAAAASGALRAALAPLRFGVVLAATMVVVNGLVSQRGDTVLVRGWEIPVLGQIDVSAEALFEGGVLALRVLVALVVFGVWSACVDPDRLLRAVRPFAARSALAATLITRLVPLAAADASRLGEAGSLRGPAAAPVGRAALVRRLVAGSLDRSVDVASTLELRGYGLDRRARQGASAPAAGGAGDGPQRRPDRGRGVGRAGRRRGRGGGLSDDRRRPRPGHPGAGGGDPADRDAPVHVAAGASPSGGAASALEGG